MGFITKLKRFRSWERIFIERFSEPLHLNLLSIFIYIFGSFRQKVKFDLVLRFQHAASLYMAADLAKEHGYHRISVLEFGVAAGAGLSNIEKISKKITKDTGIEFKIYGFDTAEGLPKPKSYKDHPELYAHGDLPMDFDRLSDSLSENTELVIGDIKDTIKAFTERDFQDCPIGFVSIDVDYYSSTLDTLELFKMNSENYLPKVVMYLDDLQDDFHNSWCGVKGAVKDFSEGNEFRKIERHEFLKTKRVFKNAPWIDHIYQAHILDHPIRNNLNPEREKIIFDNPHI